MTRTLPGADIRGCYRELGVELPEWATLEAAVRCFADPGAHAHDDRRPSCSVNLESGAYHCWGCGAKGGAYDAATEVFGFSPRAAIDLMVRYGLTEHRSPGSRSPRPAPRSSRPKPAAPRPTPAGRSTRAQLQVDDADVASWQQRLGGLEWPLRTLRSEQPPSVEPGHAQAPRHRLGWSPTDDPDPRRRRATRWCPALRPHRHPDRQDDRDARHATWG